MDFSGCLNSYQKSTVATDGLNKSVAAVPFSILSLNFLGRQIPSGSSSCRKSTLLTPCAGRSADALRYSLPVAGIAPKAPSREKRFPHRRTPGSSFFPALFAAPLRRIPFQNRTPATAYGRQLTARARRERPKNTARISACRFVSPCGRDHACKPCLPRRPERCRNDWR